MRKLFLLFLLFIFLHGFGQEFSNPVDWPQWRGPDRSGTWYGGPELDSLTSDNIKVEWEADLGSGYCGPTVSNGRVYVMDKVENSEGIRCFDLEKGSLIWEQRYEVEYAVGYPTGPRASVLIHQGKAYAWGAMGMLHCLDASSGEVLWKIDALKQYNISMPTWGLASNPIIIGDLLIVMVGGSDGSCMVAFDQQTGKEAWRALDDEASYVAPLLIRQAGQEVLVCWTGESFSGLDPATGKTHWSIPFKPLRMIMNVADPVYDPPYLLLSAFFDGTYLLEL